MIEVKDLLNELEKVNIEPLFVPTLKLIDPIMGGLPQGSVQALLSEKNQTRKNMEKLVEEIAPKLPLLIRFLGTLAESALTNFLYKTFVAISGPILKVITPLSSGLILKMVDPMVNMVIKINPALPIIVKILDLLWKIEVLFEKGIRRLLPA